MNDRNKPTDRLAGILAAGGYSRDIMDVIGRYQAVCRDRDGNTLWEDEFDNLVTNVGKALLLDATLGPSAYTLVGPFMGLISSTSFTGVAAGDQMGSGLHTGWLEAGTTNAPTYANRLTIAFSAATPGGTTTKLTSGSITFTFTGTGTVQGAFIVTGTGATNVNLATTGTLFSAGTLTTPQPVIATNTLTLTYSASLT
jgi:hypothetical protein